MAATDKLSTNSLVSQIVAWVKYRIADVWALIPSQVSSSNQLADKAFVNSSIATATATFRGTYNLVSDLSLTTSATQQQTAAALDTVIGGENNNDYTFVQIPTSDDTPTEIARIDRYKFDGTAWAYEYSLNNSSFTAEQWAAINSDITSEKVAKLDALPTGAQLTTLLAGKQDALASGTSIKTIAGQSILGSGDIKNVVIYDIVNGYPSVSDLVAVHNAGNIVMLHEIDCNYMLAYNNTTSITFYAIDDDPTTITMLVGVKGSGGAADQWHEYPERIGDVISFLYGDTSEKAETALIDIYAYYLDPSVYRSPYDAIVVCRQEVMVPNEDDPELEFLGEANTFFMTGVDDDNHGSIVLHFARIDKDSNILHFTITGRPDSSTPNITYSAITTLNIGNKLDAITQEQFNAIFNDW